MIAHASTAHVSTANDGTLALSGQLRIYDVEALVPPLLAHLHAHAELRLDLAALDELDAAGAQLLCALRRSAERAGKSFRIVRASPAVAASFSALGFPSALLPS